MRGAFLYFEKILLLYARASHVGTGVAWPMGAYLTDYSQTECVCCLMIPSHMLISQLRYAKALGDQGSAPGWLSRRLADISTLQACFVRPVPERHYCSPRA